jgi:hypothetical protein
MGSNLRLTLLLGSERVRSCFLPLLKNSSRQSLATMRGRPFQEFLSICAATITYLWGHKIYFDFSGFRGRPAGLGRNCLRTSLPPSRTNSSPLRETLGALCPVIARSRDHPLELCSHPHSHRTKIHALINEINIISPE